MRVSDPASPPAYTGLRDAMASCCGLSMRVNAASPAEVNRSRYRGVPGGSTTWCRTSPCAPYDTRTSPPVSRRAASASAVALAGVMGAVRRLAWAMAAT